MLDRKLILSEDVDEEVVFATDDRMIDAKDVLPVSNLINSMIKGEWDAIDLYNSMIATIKDFGGHDDIIEIINDIVEEEYVHVGQLEAALQGINANADKIEDGKAEGANAGAELADVAVPVEEIVLSEE